MTDEMIFASPECAEIFAALCDFQAKCEAPKRGKEVEVQGQTQEGRAFKYKFKYAPLEEIHRVIKEPMAANGLAHRQFLASRDGEWIMRTIITHKSGQWMGCDYPVIAEKRGGQGFASGTTFARRYGLTLALGIAAEDDDDGNLADGNSAAITDTRQAPRAGMVRAADVPPREATNGNGTASVQQRAREYRDAMKALLARCKIPADVETLIANNSKDLEGMKKVAPEIYAEIMAESTNLKNEMYAGA
jgi:hypothetical protein